MTVPVEQQGAQQSDVGTRIREEIARIVGPQSYRIWFKNATQLAYGEGFLKIGVPNLFIGGWIEDHFSEAIISAAKNVLQEDIQLSFAIDPVLFRKQRKSHLDSQAEFIEKNAERTIRKVRANRDAPARPVRKLRGTLDSFVVGRSNRLAFSIARSVVDSPNAECGAVFFHSACGLGKTHLLQGIANELAATKPDTRCVYTTGEEFTNQFIYALRERRLDAFRHRFRSIDVLLLDDVHFIANKKATQEEFLHTFNAIDAGGKRIIVASDAHPKMISDLSESLTNRLVAGMVVRIEKPDFETRCEILRHRARNSQHNIPEPVIRYIADKIHANVRELEGCLLKLLAFASLTKTEITLDLARQALEDHIAQTGKILTVSDIELSVSTFFGLTPADLHTSRKSRTIALARNIAMYLARKHTDLSFPEIARLMGNKNHTTVLLACRRMQKILDETGNENNHESGDANGNVSWQSVSGTQTRKLSSLIESQEEQLGCCTSQPAATAAVA